MYDHSNFMSTRSLLIQQLNNKMQSFKSLQKIAMPPTGWVKAVRLAIGMSAQQLANKLSMSRQGVQDIETREKEGSITIRSLREIANALDMQLVYGFIPNDENLEALIDRKAKELATEIVKRTSASMTLEDQENSKERIENAIKERAELIKREMPKTLWD